MNLHNLNLLRAPKDVEEDDADEDHKSLFCRIVSRNVIGNE